MVAISSAASIPGVKDFIGNYYDPYTRQLSSAITGKVYNTLPFAAPYVASYSAYVPPVAPVVAPVAAPVVAPYYNAYAYGAYPYGAAYVAPILKK